MKIQKASEIKLLLLDVDGVMTDGRIIYDDEGRELKFFHVRDGMGIKFLIEAGIEVGIISGRESKTVSKRARELGISLIYQKISNKIEIYNEILKVKSLKDKNVCYIGDDLNDYPLLKRVGFSVIVSNGTEEIRDKVDYIAKKEGGKGAVREICEIILKSQNRWEEFLKKYHFE
ncbi:MAG: HAD-IIIA family hydrolase [Thermodesulfobacteriota bacterium]|nr:HAD-IIIA family hydrolase [Thermodesulfobacteriota bacterium]